MTHLADNRNEALRVGFEATDWTQPMDYSDYLTAIKDWSVRGIVRDDKTIGAVYRKGDEVHVSILPEWRRKWATRGLLDEILTGERVVTRVTCGHEYMVDVLARLGFVPHGDRLVKG